jgi:ribosomal protein S12 methylthiotransferase
MHGMSGPEITPSERPKPAYALISLGCPKNLVDSERMAGLLRLEGHAMVGDPTDADFVVVNTCGFIADAREESYSVIAEMLDRKRRGVLRGVIVAGCLAEREQQQLLERYPEIDQVVGVFAREEIAAAAARIFDPLNEQRTVFRPAPTRPLPDTDRLRITPRHLAFLKISEGCNRTCAFCSIPRMRGPYASKPIDEIIAEARQLADDGAKELVIVAQDSSFYGIDLYGHPRLAELLDRLEAIDGVAWIRPMYLYPQNIDEPLISRLAAGGKVLPYLDVPLQHISDDILAAMRRRVNRDETERLLDRLRQRVDGLVLRTTLMVGFPGETESHFAELCEFVQRRRFERLGVFAYCPEPGTHAETLTDAVPSEVKEARRAELLAIQQPIAFAWSEARVGQQMDILLDRDIPHHKNAYIGRSYADAPEVDGAVYVSGEKLEPGELVRCEIVAAKGYDLIAAT